MTAVIAVSPAFQFSDANGVPLAAGTVDVYLAGSTTRTNTWQDRSQATLNTNPIVLNASGACSMWLDGTLAYKWVVKSSAGVEQPHLNADNVVGNGTDPGVTSLGTAALAGMQTLFNLSYLTGN